MFQKWQCYFIRDAEYVGQTPFVLKRFKDHFAHLKYGSIKKSNVAQYSIKNNYNIKINCLRYEKCKKVYFVFFIFYVQYVCG